jgi:hypothetical protein
MMHSICGMTYVILYLSTYKSGVQCILQEEYSCAGLSHSNAIDVTDIILFSVT